MWPSRTKSPLRAVRWLAPAAALALAPKCVLCVVAYLGLGTALGLGGPELCGVSSSAVSGWRLSALVAGLLGATFLLVWRLRRHHSDAALAPQMHRSITNGR